MIMKKLALLTLAALLVTTTVLWAHQADPPTISPIAKDYKISSSYGMRHHPILKVKKMHRGIDFVAEQGTPIRATSDGVVSKVIMDHRGYGNYVVIRHDEEYETLYAQMTTDIEVKVGQKVKSGQTIGYVGSSGAATGPHLHYEVLKNGENEDPEKYLGL